MLSKPELRKLIRAHNVLSKITIPKGATLEDMVKLVEKAGYKVNHEKKRLDAQVKRGKQITLKKAEEITKPKPKTALQKQKAQEKKEEKEMEQKKKERGIRKKAVEEEKIRQKDIKDKSQSTSKVEKKMPPKKKKEQEKNTEVKYSVGDKVSFSFPTDKSIKIDGEVERVNKNTYSISFEATPEIKEAMKKIGSPAGFRKFKRDGKDILIKPYTAKQLSE